MQYYGHTKEDPRTKAVLPQPEWQLLKDHLKNVAYLAKERAEKFGAGKLGEILGLAHDLGKYSRLFQQRLAGAVAKVDHATAGAQEVYRRFGQVGNVLAFAIAGHHSGLPDGHKGEGKNLPDRLQKAVPDYQAFMQEIEIPPLAQEDLKTLPVARSPEMGAFSLAFATRMLYSCLVDADYLDTERFMNQDKFQARPEEISLALLCSRLDKRLAQLAEQSRQNPSYINDARSQILARCLAMAGHKPGLFTLTVPTGGGKTYSSLAFGLKHAVEYQKERLIYVIPYTSIIEQNADVFRAALEDSAANENVVLEHHSNFEYPEEAFEEWNPREKAHRLAAENWDMPVVVTTAVQFFESLYASKGSRCRKLHNLVNSVIILDEAQMMPVEYLKPCLWALAELVLNYQATVVLCTATQPAVNALIPGKLQPVEIMEDPGELQRIFKRVTVRYVGEMVDEALATAMAAQSQVLTIVNTRRHARLLFDRLREQTMAGVYHLSARMCPAHRKIILTEIRQELKLGHPCRVVATQLIEAGVDVDFPVVYRAAAGIDSIAQAAGRCNREGRRTAGQVFVFVPEAHGMPSKGKFSEVAGIARDVMRQVDKRRGEILSLEAIEDYFRQIFEVEKNNLDAQGILKKIKEGSNGLAFPFATISHDFQLIDSATVPVVVPWDETAERLMAEAEYHPYPVSKARQLQPYVVQIYQFELAALQKEKVIKTIGGFMHFVTDRSFYDARFGLRDAKEVTAPPDVLLF